MKSFPEVILKTIPHSKQRYRTPGDYFKKNGKWYIVVSKMNPDMEFLIKIHELVELYLTQKRGVSEESITKFDIEFEKDRDKGVWKDEEPGDSPRAPYCREHKFATMIEKLCCQELSVSWEEYEKTCIDIMK